MHQAWILAAVLAAAPAGTAAADAPPAQEENVFKRAGKAIARDARTGAKQAGKAYGDAGRAIGRGTVNTTKRVGKEMKQSYKRTSKEAKETF